MGRIKSILKNKTIINGGLFSVFSFFNQGISFVLLLLLANYIAPDDYGRLSMFNTVVMFVGYFIALSSQGYLPVSFFKDSDNFKKDVSTIFAIIAIMGGVLSLVVYIFQGVLSKAFELDVKYLWIGLIVSAFHVFLNMVLDYYRVQEKIVKYGLLSCGFAIISFALALYLVVAKEQGWVGRVNSQLYCTVGIGIISIFIFAYNGIYSKDISVENIKKVALWGIPLIPHLATIWIKQGGDRLIINSVYSLSEVGVFSFALTMMSAVVMIGMAFNSAISVNIFKCLASKGNADEIRGILNKYERLSLFIYLIALLFVVIAANVLIPLLLPQYEQALPYFNILALSGFLQCLYFYYSNMFFYYSKTKSIMYITFITSVLHLSLSFLLTKYSLYYTCCIYVLSQLVVTLLARIYGNRIVREQIGTTIINNSKY